MRSFVCVIVLMTGMLLGQLWLPPHSISAAGILPRTTTLTKQLG